MNHASLKSVSLPLVLMLLALPTLASSQSIPPAAFASLRWRLVGPFRAGWATAVAGIAEQPNTFYFGGAGGGIWKTDDAGLTWHPLMQHEHSSAVGALAVSQSNPDIIYVGTGQETVRYDNMPGDGMYRSSDRGRTWEHVGLEETRHIGSILVDPGNPDRVLVAALGHVFDSNRERGVYLTRDGGRHWQQVLFINDETGAIDLASDPGHPALVYAALWQMRMHPWLDYFQQQAGPGSGIYRSEDGGEHWIRPDGRGLPEGALGRIGLAMPRGRDGRTLFATVEATGPGSGLYRSDDAGETWKLVNNERDLANNYFSRLNVAPDNPDVIYVMGRSIRRSIDGGLHFSFFRGAPGGDDYHVLWINPQHPGHMISGSDQGAIVSVNGGASWSGWENQPTGQFYHVEADDDFPYRIYSGQQDNGTVGISSRGPYGVIEERDWHPVGGDERDFMVPKPGNPDIIFGSGLGGHVSRFDNRTRQVTIISPWPVSAYGIRPGTARYRYTWLTPLVISPAGRHAMYFGAQVLFRSTDDGNQWTVISPDLSGKVEEAPRYDNPTADQARAAGFGVIISIAPSPVAENVIWVGTDDGLIQLTKDGGSHWTNVSPALLPAWGCVSTISASTFSALTAYAAVDLHRLGKHAPLILRTTDSGTHWTSITEGLPADEFTAVVREDPEHKGLLYTGTNRSVYVSLDDGGRWQSLAQNLPTTWVRDLVVHGSDIVVVTQGRGIWAMDDVGPLRQITPAVISEPVHLFMPTPAYRIRANENRDTPPPPSTPLGQNPPEGACIDYWLREPARDSVTLTVTDERHAVVRRFSSAAPEERPPAGKYFEDGWIGREQHLSAEAGMHRFLWDLRYTRPQAIGYGYTIAGVWGEGTPLEPRGPLVLPGKFTVTLRVNGRSYSQELTVMLDPRVHVPDADLREQLALAQQADSALEKAVSAYTTIMNRPGHLNPPGAPALHDTLSSLARGAQPSFSGLAGTFSGLATAIQSADAAPPQGLQNALAEYRKELDELLLRWQALSKEGN